MESYEPIDLEKPDEDYVDRVYYLQEDVASTQLDKIKVKEAIDKCLKYHMFTIAIPEEPNGNILGTSIDTAKALLLKELGLDK